MTKLRGALQRNGPAFRNANETVCEQLIVEMMLLASASGAVTRTAFTSAKARFLRRRCA
jgi:hypothetical protein